MYAVTVNGNKNFKTDIQLSGTQLSGTINGSTVLGDLIKVNDYQFHLIKNGKSYNVDLIKLNAVEKIIVIKINAQKFNLQLKDKYDELLHSLGLDAMASKKINEIKAPMPGMVLNILVAEGQEVKKGDALLILEAMKMENILKSPSDGVIKKIVAIEGNAVEKNQLLIQF